MRLPLLALSALLLAAPAWAAPPAYAPGAAAQARPLAPVQRLERHFLQISAGNLAFQADASRLAAARSSHPAVQELARVLLERQQDVQPQLVRLLHVRGMAWPLVSPKHAKVLKQLSRLQGAKFDRLYVDEVVLRTGQVDIANYEKVARDAQDPALRSWADRQLPTLRMQVARGGRALPAGVLRGQRAV